MPWHKDKSLCKLAVLLVMPGAPREDMVQELQAVQGPTRLEFDVAPALDQAVEVLRRKPYDLLLLDLPLPEEHGLDALLRAQMLASRIPIVVLSPHPAEEIALRAVEAGIQDFLVRGQLAPESVVRAFRHAVARHRALAALRRSRLAGGVPSFFDPQTGLASAAAFLRRLQEAVGLAERLGERPAVIVLEIDSFQQQASPLGPLVRARILEEVGRRLTWCLRRSDLAGRLGEDRFAVLLPNIRGSWAVRSVAERLRLAVAAPFELGALQPRLSASIGTACYPHDGETAEDLLEGATGAMLEAKGAGGNRCRFFRNLSVPSWPEADGDDTQPLIFNLGAPLRLVTELPQAEEVTQVEL